MTFYLAFSLTYGLAFYLAVFLASGAGNMVFGSRRDPLHPELAEGMKTAKRRRKVNEEEEEEGIAPLLKSRV